jgi:hypothetical protein
MASDSMSLSYAFSSYREMGESGRTKGRFPSPAFKPGKSATKQYIAGCTRSLSSRVIG